MSSSVERTSVPRIYAAGDVTEQVCTRHGAAVRIETWDNANRQGEAAASHVAAPESESASTMTDLPPPPWFWSDQYGANMQVVGAPGRADCVVASADDTDRKLSIHLRDGIVVGAVAINGARDMRRLRKLMAERAPVTRALLEAQGFVA